MRLIHLADLHLGKKVNVVSMEEEQKHVLDQVISYIEKNTNTDDSIQGVMIAGDVYDRTVPPVTAVTMFDEFITELVNLNMEIFIISGNHDSAERLGFGSKLFEKNHLHLVSMYNGSIAKTTVKDAYGDLNVYMLPFIRPVDVRQALDVEVSSYQEALEKVIANEDIDTTKRNILIAHQNIIGAARSDSEDISIGGLDGISADVFDCFDYVALGHLHQSQKLSSGPYYYAGSPIKYSFSEVNHKKGFNVVTFKEKGAVSVDKVQLTPVHDMREIEGKFEDILSGKYDIGKSIDDYISVILTDEEEVLNGARKLRDHYPNFMQMKYNNKRTQSMSTVEDIVHTDTKSPEEYIEEFFEATHNKTMSDVQRNTIHKLVKKIWEGEE